TKSRPKRKLRGLMKGCARTCLLWILGWGAASFAFFRYFITLGNLYDGLWWASGGAGLAAVIAFAYVYGIVATARERSILLDSINGTPPRDGKWSAVSGRIHSMNKLTAPFSGESVVAYKYAVQRMEGSSKSRTLVKHFEGTALIPSTISTRTGSVRLLSVPTFDIEKTEINLLTGLDHARRYIESTVFETSDTPKDQRAGTVEKESTDDDGNFRVDKRSDRAFDVDLENCDLEEFHIKQNEQVCVFGLYSAARGGLIPHPNWGKQTRIMRGDGEAVAAKLRNRIVKYAIGVAVFSGIAYGVVLICRHNAVPFTQ
ncbi:MAG TPA: hypothetical protein VF787_17470, partial [Thermoanaerobaculia bacterium]